MSRRVVYSLLFVSILIVLTQALSPIYVNDDDFEDIPIQISELKSNQYMFDSRLTNEDERFTVNLGGSWQLTNANQSIVVTALVPGNVHTDLLRAGVIQEDPYYRYNDMYYRWIGLDDWSYTSTFWVSDAHAKKSKLILVCEGLDSAATVIVNGQTLGKTDNMFRRYTWDVTKIIKSGENMIKIDFISAETYAAMKHESYPYFLPSADSTAQNGEPFRNYIRKEQCTFSWDWGPCFIPMGIWQPIGIVAFDEARIEYVGPQITGSDDLTSWIVDVTVYLDAASAFSARVETSLAGVNTVQKFTTHVGENRPQLSFTIQNPNLWWPRGYGSPNLYELQVKLIHDDNGKLIDSLNQTIGFRKVQVIQDPVPGQNGATFYFQVNNIPIFAKGSNWIPADSFENKVTVEVLENILSSAADANMNIIRNWGGGIYQHEAFYRICNEKGLMVWWVRYLIRVDTSRQEFMFACAMYPRDSAFLESTSEEVLHQIKRLMHHPSIILWSGNNENEAALWWFQDTIQNRDRYLVSDFLRRAHKQVDYVKLYFDTIRESLLSVDQSRNFWPSSPSNGPLVEDPYVGIWGDVSNTSVGDVHFYNYDMMCNNITQLPNARFVSEYGFQSMDSFYSWVPVTIPDDWNRNSDMMQHRQHHDNGIQQLENEIEMHFKFVEGKFDNQTDFENWIYLTQSMQSLCMKAQTEHYRRSRSLPAMTMGAIYWQLNSIWQAPTWSSLEYGGRWKMMHYAVKKFFAPVLISSFENPAGMFNVHVTSDHIQSLTFAVSITLWNWSGTQLTSINLTSTVPALSSASVYTSQISQLISGYCSSRSDCFVTLSCKDATTGQLYSINEFFLSELANVTLEDPKIQLTNIQALNNTVAKVTVSSSAPAPYVFLQTSLNGRFSDNAFLLLPGSENAMTVYFYGWSSFDLDSFAQSLSVKSIRDTYP